MSSTITQDRLNKLEHMLKAKDSILGENHWASILKYHTFTQSGLGNPTIGKYEIIYRVAYDRDTINEYFRLEKDTKTDSIKIMDYKVLEK